MSTLAEADIAGAIDLSVRENRIVFVLPEHERERVALGRALFEKCDGTSTGNDGLVEFWGTTDDGCSWRVHLRAAPPEGA